MNSTYFSIVFFNNEMLLYQAVFGHSLNCNCLNITFLSNVFLGIKIEKRYSNVKCSSHVSNNNNMFVVCIKAHAKKQSNSSECLCC